MFDKFFSDNDIMVAETAQELDNLNKQLEAGNLSYEEFNELADDLLDIDRIKANMADVKRAAYIEKAFDIFKMLIKSIAKIA